MQIVDVVPLPDPGGGNSRNVARFSVELPGLKIGGFRLRQRADGSFFAASPQRDGVRVVNLSPDLFHQINQAAAAAYRSFNAPIRARV